MLDVQNYFGPYAVAAKPQRVWVVGACCECPFYRDYPDDIYRECRFTGEDLTHDAQIDRGGFPNDCPLLTDSIQITKKDATVGEVTEAMSELVDEKEASDGAAIISKAREVWGDSGLLEAFKHIKLAKALGFWPLKKGSRKTCERDKNRG
jgi:hypothetical protein